jgi:hypothetical protein
MSDFESRLRRLEELAGNIPARFGAPAIPVIDGIYQTIPDKGGNYPVPPGPADTFYCQKVLPSFSEIVGIQNFMPPQTSGQSYIFNLSGKYISQGSYVPGWTINGQIYTTVGGIGLFYGTTTAPTVSVGAPVNVTQTLNGPPISFSTTFDQVFACLPTQWPVIGAGIAGETIWLLRYLDLTQNATLDADLCPSGQGYAHLVYPTGYPQILVNDVNGRGGTAGASVMVQYTCSGWNTLTGNGCA